MVVKRKEQRVVMRKERLDVNRSGAGRHRVACTVWHGPNGPALGFGLHLNVRLTNQIMLRPCQRHLVRAHCYCCKTVVLQCGLLRHDYLPR